MQIRRLTSDGRIASRVRALHPAAAPHAWEATEGVRLTAPAEGNRGTRDGETVEVWLDARSLAAIDAIRDARSADEVAILEDAARYRRACAAVNAARRKHEKAPTTATATASALTNACDERLAAEIALKFSARAGAAGRHRSRP